MNAEEPKKPFYQRVWFFALIGFIVARFLLPSSEQKEFTKLMNEGESAFASEEYQEALLSAESALGIMPDSDKAASLGESAEKELAKIYKAEEKKRQEIDVQKKKEEIQEGSSAIETAFLESIDESTTPGNAKRIIYNVFKDSYTNPNEIVTDIQFDEQNTLSATIKGKDGWSDKSIGLGFYEDATATYRELAKDERITEAWLTITFPMKDTHGNVKDEEVMTTWMSRETMNEINWDNFDYQRLLDVVDGVSIYPQFTQ